MRKTEDRSRDAREVQIRRLGFAHVPSLLNQTLDRKLQREDGTPWFFLLLTATWRHWFHRLGINPYPAPLLLGARCRAASQWQGIAHALPHNRRGSCWLLHELSLLPPQEQVPTELPLQLVRAAISAAPACSGWLTRVDCLDRQRLALFRQAGFQPILTQGIWWLDGAAVDPAVSTSSAEAGLRCPQGYAFHPFQPADKPKVLSLDSATTPVQLRRLQDRSGQDLWNETVAGLLLEDCRRQQLAAAVRLVRQPPCIWKEPPQVLCRVDVAVHPGHQHLYGDGALRAGLLHLLNQQPRRWQLLAASGVGLRCNQGQTVRQQWLQDLGARHGGDELLMARSVWRRQDSHGQTLAAGRLKRILQRLGPRGQPVPDGSARLPVPLGRHRG